MLGIFHADNLIWQTIDWKKRIQNAEEFKSLEPTHLKKNSWIMLQDLKRFRRKIKSWNHLGKKNCKPPTSGEFEIYVHIPVRFYTPNVEPVFFTRKKHIIRSEEKGANPWGSMVERHQSTTSRGCHENQIWIVFFPCTRYEIQGGVFMQVNIVI